MLLTSELSLQPLCILFKKNTEKFAGSSALKDTGVGGMQEERIFFTGVIITVVVICRTGEIAQLVNASLASMRFF